MTQQRKRLLGKWRLLLTSALIGAGLVLIGLATVSTLRTQRYDGVRINLAGRQRMLSQKLTKEILRFADGQLEPAAPRRTMRVFDLTLHALADGGRAPLDLELTRFQAIPAMNHAPTRQQLGKVMSLWHTLERTVEHYLEHRDRPSLRLLVGLNLELLQEMERSVLLMQKRSERNSKRIAVVLGLTVVSVLGFLGLLLFRKFRQLRSAAQRIEKLETLLPMCSSCKSVRREGADGDTSESWVPVEAYLEGLGEPEITHSLCPGCVAKLYPGLRSRTKAGRAAEDAG